MLITDRVYAIKQDASVRLRTLDGEVGRARLLLLSTPLLATVPGDRNRLAFSPWGELLVWNTMQAHRDNPART